MPTDFHLLPRLSTIRATKETHARRQEHCPRPRWTHAQCMRVHHALDLCIAGKLALEVLLFCELEQFLRAVAPGLTAIQAADYAADLYARVEFLWLVRISREANDAAREPHTYHPRRLDDGETLPTLSAVVAAINGGWRSAEIENLWVLRVEEDRPYNQVLVRKIEAFPMVAAVQAAIRAVLGAHIDDLWVVRMNGDSPHLCPVRKTLVERSPFVLAHCKTEKAARLRCVTRSTPGRCAGIDVLHHTTVLLFAQSI